MAIELPRPKIKNANELSFKRLGSKYGVATAGAKAGGRGQTPNLFHGSEVGFWENAADHFKASVQGVPERPGSWVVLESTANGAQGEFYEQWNKAEAGESDFIPIFVPWFWQEEYRREVPEGFQLSEEKDDTGLSEREYADIHELSLEQMVWRRKKITTLGAAGFRQEYPATSQEAFVASSDNSFIEPAAVLRARKRKNVAGYGPMIMGVDPAGWGGDRFAIALRRGTEVEKIMWRDKIDSVAAAHWVVDLIKEHGVDTCNIDAGGIGQGVIPIIRSLVDKSTCHIRAVNFGGTSDHKQAKPKVPGPRNKRAEMWLRMKQWLVLEEGVKLPDLDVLSSEMTGVQVKPQLNNDLLLESKDQMRARNVRSPDLADAICLTFASLRDVELDKPQRPKRKEFDAGVRQERTGEYRLPMPDDFTSGLEESPGGDLSWMC